MTENGTPDRWDIVQGHYVFCMLWHGGQSCPLYARLCRITRPRFFKPSPMGINLDADGEEGGREVYLELCRKHGFEHSEDEEIRA
jgi:hypothetical protein